MPTPYTGDPTAVEPPDIAPEAEAFPIVNIPIAGEDLDVSSIAQFVQNITNNISWLKRPRAKTANYTLPLVRWRNEKNEPVARVDAFGLVGGPVRTRHEDFPTHFREFATTAGALVRWGFIVSGAASGTSEAYPSWSYGIVNSASYTADHLLRSMNPDIASSRVLGSRLINIRTPPSVVDDYSFIARRTPWMVGINVLASLEFRIPYGLCPGPLLMGWLMPNASSIITSEFDPDTPPNGIYVRAHTSDTNLQLCVGSGATPTDLGVARGDLALFGARFRLVFIGSELDLGNANRVLCFINDALVANVTAGLPAAGTVPWLYFGGKSKTPGGLVLNLEVKVADIHEQHFLRP